MDARSSGYIARSSGRRGDQQLCRFVNRPGGCNRGARCPFLHPAASASSAAEWASEAAHSASPVSLVSSSLSSSPSSAAAAATSVTIIEELICGVCTEPLGPTRDRGLIECSHVFCYVCIQKWWVQDGGASCPECRRRLVNKPMRVKVDPPRSVGRGAPSLSSSSSSAAAAAAASGVVAAPLAPAPRNMLFIILDLTSVAFPQVDAATAVPLLRRVAERCLSAASTQRTALTFADVAAFRVVMKQDEPTDPATDLQDLLVGDAALDPRPGDFLSCVSCVSGGSFWRVSTNVLRPELELLRRSGASVNVSVVALSGINWRTQCCADLLTHWFPGSTFVHNASVAPLRAPSLRLVPADVASLVGGHACDRCKMVFASSQLLNAHVAECIRCRACTSWFQTLAELEAHGRAQGHAVRQGQSWSCARGCGSTFLSEAECKQHEDNVCSYCFVCERTLAHRQGLRNHCESVGHVFGVGHSFNCRVCREGFLVVSERDDHANKTGHSAWKGCWQCEHCDCRCAADFMTRLDLANHYVSVYAESIQWFCCGRTFTNRHAFQQHSDAKHE